MSKKPNPDEEGLALVLSIMTRSGIARRLGIKKQNLTRWKVVPTNHVTKLAEITGIPRARIKPSVYA